MGFAERVEELRALLGLSQNQFMLRLGLKRNVYTMWKTSGQQADRDTLVAICARWLVDMNSLWGLPGTVGLEPHPALRNAQDSLALSLSRTDTGGSPTDRLRLTYLALSTSQSPIGRPLLPELTPDAWVDWLQWEPSEWQAALEGKVDAGNPQLRGAAQLLGWYEGRDAWERWFRSGYAAELAAPSERVSKALAELLVRSGLDVVDLRQMLRERAKRT